MRECKPAVLRHVLLVWYSGGTQLDTEDEGTTLLLKVGVRNQRHSLAYQKNWLFSNIAKRSSSLARRLIAELGTCERYVMDEEFWSGTVKVRHYSETRHMCQNGKQIRKPVLKMECLSVDSSGWWQFQRREFLNKTIFVLYCNTWPFSDQSSNIGLTRRPVLHGVRSTQFNFTWGFHTVWRRSIVLVNKLLLLVGRSSKGRHKVNFWTPFPSGKGGREEDICSCGNALYALDVTPSCKSASVMISVRNRITNGSDGK